MGALNMSTNLVHSPLSAQGVQLAQIDRENRAKENRRRMDGEVWAQRYHPTLRDVYAGLLAEMHAPMAGSLAAVAGHMGVSADHMRAYYDCRRSMPAPVFVAHFLLPMRETAHASDLALARFSALKGRALPQGTVEAVHRAFSRALEHFGVMASVVVMALEDGRVDPHEVTRILLGLRRQHQLHAEFEACVVAAEVRQ